MSEEKSLCCAIRERYIEDDDDDADVDATTGAVGGLEVVFVGASEVRQARRRTKRLVTIHVRELGITHCGGVAGDGVSTLADLVPRLRDLDVSGNRVRDAMAFMAALRETGVPLREVNLTQNPVHIDAQCPMWEHPWHALSTLSLMGTGVTWRAVCERVSPCLPGLASLFLADNGWGHGFLSCDSGTDHDDNDDAAASPQALEAPQLRELHLGRNRLQRWTLDVVPAMARLHGLQRLVLSGNSDLLAQGAPATQTQGSWLPELRELSLDDTHVASWATLEAVRAWCPLVTKVRIRRTPITQAFGDVMTRMGVIARWAHVTHVNGGALAPDERKTAEMAYMKEIVAQHEPEDGSPMEVNSSLPEHPRWSELCETYDTYAATLLRQRSPSSSGKAGGKEHHMSMCDFTLRCNMAPSYGRTVRKRFPAAMTVASLKTAALAIFGLSGGPLSIELQWTPCGETFFVAMSRLDAPLSFFGMHADVADGPSGTCDVYAAEG